MDLLRSKTTGSGGTKTDLTDVDEHVDEHGKAALLETMKHVKSVLDANARELNEQVAQLHSTQLLTKRFEAQVQHGGASGSGSSSTGSGPTAADIEELEAQVRHGKPFNFFLFCVLFVFSFDKIVRCLFGFAIAAFSTHRGPKAVSKYWKQQWYECK